MNSKRRVFLKGTLAASAVGVAVGAGLLAPRSVLAAWPEAAFQAESVSDALSAAMGSSSLTEGDVVIRAPDIAENGAVVPITVESTIAGATSVAILTAEANVPADLQLRPRRGRPADDLHPHQDGRHLRHRRGGQGQRPALQRHQGSQGHHRRLRRLRPDPQPAHVRIH
jgi:predicted secreted protein